MRRRPTAQKASSLPLPGGYKALIDAGVHSPVDGASAAGEELNDRLPSGTRARRGVLLSISVTRYIAELRTFFDFKRSKTIVPGREVPRPAIPVHSPCSCSPSLFFIIHCLVAVGMVVAGHASSRQSGPIFFRHSAITIGTGTAVPGAIAVPAVRNLVSSSELLPSIGQ